MVALIFCEGEDRKTVGGCFGRTAFIQLLSGPSVQGGRVEDPVSSGILDGFRSARIRLKQYWAP